MNRTPMLTRSSNAPYGALSASIIFSPFRSRLSAHEDALFRACRQGREPPLRVKTDRNRFEPHPRARLAGGGCGEVLDPRQARRKRHRRLRETAFYFG